MSIKNCPGLHGLNLFNTPHVNYSCDGCQKTMKLNAKMYGCRNYKCNYDLCEDCYLFQPHSIKGCKDLTELAEKLSNYTKEEKIDDKLNITDVLNNFHHLLHEHDDNDAFEYIVNFIGKCDINKCTQFRRNYRMAEYEHMHVTAKQSILDEIHCCFLHCYDIGFRLTNKDINEINKAKAHQRQNIISTRIVEKKKMLSPDIQKIISYKDNNKFNQLKGLIDSKEETFDRFDFGWRYFYWDQYKSIPSVGYDLNRGSTVTDFCVSCKYESLKRELIENEIFKMTKEQWNTTWKIASEKHISRYGKTFAADPFDKGDFLIKRMYGIKKNDPIKCHHLMAVIVYCNFDGLSNTFSKSFRLKPNENFDKLIKRHINFYFLSRYIHEAIHCFSQPTYAEKTVVFFHGISENMIFDSVECMMHQPFSTTESWEIAVNFTANTGIVIELKPNCWTKYFDCVYVSGYAAEKEKLFLGNSRTMVFTNITNVVSNYDYRIFIKCISIIDTMTKGTFYQNDDANFSYRKYYKAFLNAWSKSESMGYHFNKEIPILESYKDITKKMIKHELCRYDTEQCDEKIQIDSYVEQLLHNVCVKKTKVSINWQSLNVDMKETLIDLKHCVVTDFNGNYCGYSFLKEMLCEKNVEMVNLKLIKKLFPNSNCILLSELDIISNNVLDTVFNFLWQPSNKPIAVFELRLCKKSDNKLKVLLAAYNFQEKNEYIMGLKEHIDDKGKRIVMDNTIVIKKSNNPLAIVQI